MPPSSRRGGRSSSRKLSPQSPAKSAPVLQPDSPNTRRADIADVVGGPTSPLASIPESIQTGQEAAASLAPFVPLPTHSEIDESAAATAQLPRGTAGVDAGEDNNEPSDFQEMLDALNYDLLVESLPDLKDESVKFLANFHRNDPNDLAAYLESLSGVKSASATRCMIAFRKILATRDAFGPRKWMIAELIATKLQQGQSSPEIPDGMWRPDAIIYLGNLAHLVATLTLPGVNTPHGMLQDAFDFFPHHYSFNRPDSRFTSPDVAALVRIGDAVRTQLFISSARRTIQHPGSDFEDLIASIFYDQDYANRIRPLVQRLPSYASDFDNRLAQIRAAFSKHNDVDYSLSLDKLENAFPWDDFVLEVVTWALQREQELLALIEAQDAGIEGIINAIKSSNFNIPPNPVGRYPKTTTSAAATVATAASALAQMQQPGKAGRGRGKGRGKTPLAYVAAVKRDMADLSSRKAARVSAGAGDAATATTLTAIAAATTATTTPRSANLFENQDAANAAAALMAYNQNPHHEDDGGGGYAPVADIDDDDTIPTSAQGPSAQLPAQISGDVQNAQATELARNAINQVELEQEQLQHQQLNQQLNQQNAPRQITKSFMDPQPNAQRVAWTEDSQSVAPSPGASHPRKRRASFHSSQSLPTADNDETDDPGYVRTDRQEEEQDDEGFEDDVRAAHASKRARTTALAAAAARARVDKGKGRASPHPTAPSSSSHNNVDDYPSSSTQGPPADSTQQQSSQTPKLTYQEVNSQAKARGILNRASQPNTKVQHRRPWTPAEEERLIELIGLNGGPRWAQILKDDLAHPHGPLVNSRTQVQCKDKARNMKIDYYKSRIPLPPGFAGVSIGQRAHDKLVAEGYIRDDEDLQDRPESFHVAD